MRTNGKEGGGFLAQIPEEFHPALLDRLARQQEHGEDNVPPEIEQRIAKEREVRGWQAIYMLARDNPDAWDMLLTYLNDTARKFLDEVVEVANQEDDPAKVFGKVKSRSGAAFGLFVASHSLSLGSLANKARLASHGR
jgi:hypothetical protein